MPGRALTHERRVFLLALLAGFPGALVSGLLLFTGDHSTRLRWTLGALILLGWWGFAAALRGAVVRPLQTLANLLSALREEDFSFRFRARGRGDALGEVALEVNALAETLRQQRLGALEASALLRTVMEEIDVAVFAFDGEGRLRLANRAGERLLARPVEQLVGRRAEELGLGEALGGEATRTLEIAFPGASGRWEVRRGVFRQGGLPHQLLVLADVSRALREEERQAWQRLIRVMGHELNNSLAPIRSIADSLAQQLGRPRAADWEEDARQGLRVIGARAEALGRFTEGYSRLARLPPPKRQRVALEPLLRRVAGLETRKMVPVEAGPDLAIRADADQLEQLLINLVRNAADAALETGGGVRLSWRRADGSEPAVEVLVEDEGPGLPRSANLFVPFFTTKPQGTGIGLVLSRQIAEAHGGSLTLEDRVPGPGCCARLRLPLSGPSAAPK
jgi:two-component system, NtrC family, nitrogen regulation sensor histidine kinase NtrY